MIWLNAENDASNCAVKLRVPFSESKVTVVTVSEGDKEKALSESASANIAKGGKTETVKVSSFLPPYALRSCGLAKLRFPVKEQTERLASTSHSKSLSTVHSSVHPSKRIPFGESHSYSITNESPQIYIHYIGEIA